VGGVLLIGAIGTGVWAWETVGPGRLCDVEKSVTMEFGPGVRSYPSVEEALLRFGRFPDIRADLPVESLVPTDEDSPEFGATIDPDFLANGRRYDIWKNGDVVQTVVLDQYRDGWVISGYGGCSPIP